MLSCLCSRWVCRDCFHTQLEVAARCGNGGDVLFREVLWAPRRLASIRFSLGCLCLLAALRLLAVTPGLHPGKIGVRVLKLEI